MAALVALHASTATALTQAQVAAGASTVPADTELADGEIRKIDPETGKITLKHGPLRHLDMPGMTMVFRTADPALLAGLNAGDRVRFLAEKVNGAFTVTKIEPMR